MLDRTRAGSRRRKAARPRELLDAALAVFIQKGFAAARPEEIALHAGVSKGTLYVYFHSKEDMLAALIDECFSSRIAPAAAIPQDDATASRDLIRDAITSWRCTQVQGDAGGIFKLVFAEARAFPSLAQFWLREVMEPMRGMLSPLVARGIARGEFRAVDPDLVVCSLVLPVVMVCLHRHAMGPSVQSDRLLDGPDLFDRHLDFVLEGLTLPSHH